MLLTGFVKDINSKELVIGLPNGLNGYVEMNDVNRVLQKLSANIESEDEEEEESADDEKESENKVNYILLLANWLAIITKAFHILQVHHYILDNEKMKRVMK